MGIIYEYEAIRVRQVISTTLMLLFLDDGVKTLLINRCCLYKAVMINHPDEFVFLYENKKKSLHREHLYTITMSEDDNID